MEYSTKIHRHSFDYVTMYMWIAEMKDLNQNEKLIFSKIYNFCKSKNQRFYGSLEYLSKQTAMCTRSVCNALKTLKEKKLVFKDVEEVSFGKAKSCYYINDDETKKDIWDYCRIDTILVDGLVADLVSLKALIPTELGYIVNI